MAKISNNSKNNSSSASLTQKSTNRQRTTTCKGRRILVYLTLPILWILCESIWQRGLTTLSPLQQQHQQRRADDVSNSPPRPTPVIGIEDLPDIAPVQSLYYNHSMEGATWEEAMVGREPLLRILEQAGLSVNLHVLKLLPTWETVKELYGADPVILGQENCASFRRKHKNPSQRFTGIVGLHNCGTNAMARYLKQNVHIPGNSREGFMAHVPWHKHGWASLRHTYNFSFPSDHDSVLPIVIVRDPYTWMRSMCESPYLLQWEHTARHCPNLVQSDGATGNPAETEWGTHHRKWESLAHVWSEFYNEYMDADYPRLVIRFEDVLFHTEQVVDKIRECAGGVWKEDHFVHAPSAVKSNKYFTDIKPQSSLLSAIIKYGQDRGMRLKQMTKADQSFAFEHLDSDLMERFQYVHPTNDVRQ